MFEDEVHVSEPIINYDWKSIICAVHFNSLMATQTEMTICQLFLGFCHITKANTFVDGSSSYDFVFFSLLSMVYI